MKKNACLIGFILGAAGIAGAIELGRGWIPSIAILALSIAGLMKEVNHVEKKHDHHNNIADYPCYLKK